MGDEMSKEEGPFRIGSILNVASHLKQCTALHPDG
jgi:hypothetical protein